ncbi:MAG: VWA domain-containing protein, partial [Beijerinckiaceae bacterium]|nr:VWA domain-containing protein [Beijerinckiaceae bacterium]
MTKVPGKFEKPSSSVQTGGTKAVDVFLNRAANTPVVQNGNRGRLVFALDATMSRQPAWDIAQSVQGRMFDIASRLGGLDVQLVYFRGFMECRASGFVANGSGLGLLMAKIDVRGGQTQIGKVLSHVLFETKKKRVGALVYVGDAMEEDADTLCHMAGVLGLLGLKACRFHE